MRLKEDDNEEERLSQQNDLSQFNILLNSRNIESSRFLELESKVTPLSTTDRKNEPTSSKENLNTIHLSRLELSSRPSNHSYSWDEKEKSITLKNVKTERPKDDETVRISLAKAPV
jgi:hypothetical protein